MHSPVPPHLSEDKLLVLWHRLPGILAQVHSQVGGDGVPHSTPCWLPGVIADLPTLIGVLKELQQERRRVCAWFVLFLLCSIQLTSHTMVPVFFTIILVQIHINNFVLVNVHYNMKPPSYLVLNEGHGD